MPPREIFLSNNIINFVKSVIKDFEQVNTRVGMQKCVIRINFPFLIIEASFNYVSNFVKFIAGPDIHFVTENIRHISKCKFIKFLQFQSDLYRDRVVVEIHFGCVEFNLFLKDFYHCESVRTNEMFFFANVVFKNRQISFVLLLDIVYESLDDFY